MRGWEEEEKEEDEEQEGKKSSFVLETWLYHCSHSEKIGSPGNSIQKRPGWGGNILHHETAKSTRTALRRKKKKKKAKVALRKQRNTQNLRFFQNRKPFQIKEPVHISRESPHITRRL